MCTHTLARWVSLPSRLLIRIGISLGYRSLSFMKKIVPILGSEWSFTHFRLPDTSVRSLCAFGQEKNSIIGTDRPSPSP